MNIWVIFLKFAFLPSHLYDKEGDFHLLLTSGATKVAVFGSVLRRFSRKVFCFLQFWALEGSIHLLLSAISFLITTNFATEQYGHP
jgi:hypothetical protein